MMTGSRFLTANLLLLGVLIYSTGEVSAQTRIGVAATVKNQVFGGGKPLSTGASVHAQETIKTGEASSASLQFVDQTNLNVGPKSEVKLDRFVYDPSKAGKGSVVINTGRGAFRFVSGTQNHNSYKINTPVATIGVRGTVFYLINGPTFTVLVQQNGSTVVTLGNGQTITVAAGYSVLIQQNGAFETFKNSDSTINIQQAGLDMTLLQEYTTFIGQTASSFGGLPAIPRIICGQGHGG
jgi:hypothetical protein